MLEERKGAIRWRRARHADGFMLEKADASAASIYLGRHPEAELYASFSDFAF